MSSSCCCSRSFRRATTSTVLAQGAVPGGFGAEIWTFVTYALIHGDWTHLGLNACGCCAFGTPVARRFGALRFLAFFAVTAAAGAAAHLATHAGNAFVPMVGASASISGFMAAAMRFAFQRGGPLRLIGRRSGEPIACRRCRSSRCCAIARVLVFLVVWFGLNLLFGIGSIGARRRRAGDRLAGAYRRLPRRAAGVRAVRSGEGCAARRTAGRTAGDDSLAAACCVRGYSAARSCGGHDSRLPFDRRRQATDVKRSCGALSSGATNDWRCCLGASNKEVPMTVKAILSRKGRDVVTIAPTANLSAAVKLLASAGSARSS